VMKPGTATSATSATTTTPSSITFHRRWVNVNPNTWAGSSRRCSTSTSTWAVGWPGTAFHTPIASGHSQQILWFGSIIECANRCWPI
jgi:hypothetical protein